MNLHGELPERTRCLMCFMESMERRTCRAGRAAGKKYYTCTLCNFRLFINSDVHAFGLAFWHAVLADGKLAETARANLEEALRQKAQPVAQDQVEVPVLGMARPESVQVPSGGDH